MRSVVIGVREGVSDYASSYYFVFSEICETFIAFKRRHSRFSIYRQFCYLNSLSNVPASQCSSIFTNPSTALLAWLANF